MSTPKPFITSVSTKTVVRVSSYEDQVMTGTISNEFYGKTYTFCDVVQMAAILESLFDSLSFPQSSMAYRSFRAAPKRRGMRESKDVKSLKAGGQVDEVLVDEAVNGEPVQKDKASFVVHVQFRQNATWQGTITWVEKGVTQHFRSVLEMIRLMTESIEADPNEIVWSDENTPM